MLIWHISETYVLVFGNWKQLLCCLTKGELWRWQSRSRNLLGSVNLGLTIISFLYIVTQSHFSTWHGSSTMVCFTLFWLSPQSCYFLISRGLSQSTSTWSDSLHFIYRWRLGGERCSIFSQHHSSGICFGKFVEWVWISMNLGVLILLPGIRFTALLFSCSFSFGNFLLHSAALPHVGCLFCVLSVSLV